MKRFLSLVLVAMLVSAYYVNANAAVENCPTIDYVRTSGLVDLALVSGNADESGTAYITLNCYSESAATYRIAANCYIEKYTNGNWVRMRLEDGTTYWIVNSGSKTMDQISEQKLTAGKGLYRVTATFSVISGMGTESVTRTSSFTYT